MIVRFCFSGHLWFQLLSSFFHLTTFSLFWPGQLAPVSLHSVSSRALLGIGNVPIRNFNSALQFSLSIPLAFHIAWSSPHLDLGITLLFRPSSFLVVFRSFSALCCHFFFWKSSTLSHISVPLVPRVCSETTTSFVRVSSPCSRFCLLPWVVLMLPSLTWLYAPQTFSPAFYRRYKLK